jgi:protein-disulfide isomerase
VASRTAQKRQSARQALVLAERRASARRRARNAIVASAVVSAFAVAGAVVGSGEGSHATAAQGTVVANATYSSTLLAGIPQHGLLLGEPNAPVRMVEFADLQCPYCGEFARQALPQLIVRYVRTGRLSIEFRNLSFIGPDSVRAGRVAAAAAQQDRLWNFIDLMYLNQGKENSGYATDSYLGRLLAKVPGLDVARALHASQEPQAVAALNAATDAAVESGVNATPSFLLGRSGGVLRRFEPESLTSEAFIPELNSLLGGQR